TVVICRMFGTKKSFAPGWSCSSASGSAVNQSSASYRQPADHSQTLGVSTSIGRASGTVGSASMADGTFGCSLQSTLPLIGSPGGLAQAVEKLLWPTTNRAKPRQKLRVRVNMNDSLRSGNEIGGKRSAAT